MEKCKTCKSEFYFDTNNIEQIKLTDECIECQEKSKNKQVKPIMLKEIDIEAIKKIAQDYMDERVSDEYHEDNDWNSYIFEVVLCSCFGDDVFEKLND